ncbi:MAG: indole-3-glycerol-phosphate synthase [Dehalococcoidia bacterium]|nr:indole-3-glycerol-phosphate synthase [Dehalococcoidia bacterium]
MFLGAFSKAIASENAMGFAAVIPDIKCFSPEKGELLHGRDPVEMARCFVSYGAPVLSVVTEKEHFGGSQELLHAITNAVTVPVLRKDFITSESMLKDTVTLGASAVLLICAITDNKTLAALYNKALERGLEPLVEVHTEQEMEFAIKLKACLIGVNNRDIRRLERDNGRSDQTVALAANVPNGTLLISESGILSPSDAKLAVSAGADAILVGTALWQADDVETVYHSLRVERGNKCVQL